MKTYQLPKVPDLRKTKAKKKPPMSPNEKRLDYIKRSKKKHSQLRRAAESQITNTVKDAAKAYKAVQKKYEGRIGNLNENESEIIRSAQMSIWLASSVSQLDGIKSLINNSIDKSIPKKCKKLMKLIADLETETLRLQEYYITKATKTKAKIVHGYIVYPEIEKEKRNEIEAIAKRLMKASKAKARKGKK